ncbi:hypothetical protein P3S68_018997 [Capsicum galapagoense]
MKEYLEWSNQGYDCRRGATTLVFSLGLRSSSSDISTTHRRLYCSTYQGLMVLDLAL